MRPALGIPLLFLLGACSSGATRTAARHDATARRLESQSRYDEALREREAADAAQSGITTGRAPREEQVPPPLTPYRQ